MRPLRATATSRMLASALLWTLAPISRAQDVIYVTDLYVTALMHWTRRREILTTCKAPCAASAVSQNIARQILSKNCPDNEQGLQSCICNSQFAIVSSGMSATVSTRCGSSATDDQASASTVLSAYYNQNVKVAFPMPANPVSSYIHEYPAISDLAPCASSGLSVVMNAQTYMLCPPNPTALAPCACEKNRNSAFISSSIAQSVAALCSSNPADVSSAQALFAGYCALNAGTTTTMPVASSPPGDMSYYITDLPQYSSLASCAQRAIFQAVSYQTYALCRDSGPQALASCVCLKTSMQRFVSSAVVSSARFFCSSGVQDSVESAGAVLDFYCRAASAEATATGIVVSSSASAPGASRSGSMRSTVTATQAPGGLERGARGPSAGIIAGAVVGGVAGLVLGALCVFCVMRHARRRAGAGRPLQTQEQRGSEISRCSRPRDLSSVAAVAGCSNGAASHDIIDAPPPYDAGPNASPRAKK
ncbi:uncharacterized protein E0L32_007986 [Thyridium curvatum]|uniref:Extracellular membrane protein CFEM domain-containing protein n=1 Tax=Thyridium curvatum TaxID=1093900 RepID=A0A507AKR5_9PEZI|nr:uncharacterized protein E0L32_007986 [Thyridium curvatum]TPX11125.1 hypothetical protein E0L32_007986 [Thyridium curvatum]